MEEQVISEDVLYLCCVLFQECVEYWGIIYERLAYLIEKYKLISFINEFEDVFQEQAVISDIEELEGYINRCGGSIY